MSKNSSFVADIDAFVTKSEQRMLAMTRYALTDLINDMQTPVAKGGRLRVDTGFLRASGRATLDGLPSGNGNRPADAPVGKYTGVYDNWEGGALVPVLNDMKLGDTFYWGWVANYAEVRNEYDGFMSTAVQNWQDYVNGAVRKVKEDVG